jgi:hypothetical protein
MHITFSIIKIQSATMEPSPTRALKALAIERRADAKLAKLANPPKDMQLLIIQRIVALLKERREKAIKEGKIGRGMLKALEPVYALHLLLIEGVHLGAVPPLPSVSIFDRCSEWLSKFEAGW